MWCRYLVLALVFTLGTSALHDPLVVNTRKGKVKGKTVKTALGGEVDAWYSIPFAKPPVGDLRFRHPIPIDRWHDVKDATELPNSCWQTLDDFFGNFEGSTMWNANTPMSEDCLYLSIIVPKPRPTNVPVLVWIYGGGFYSGTSSLEVYDYRTLADNQNVIIVAPHYRIASLGFLYMGTPDVPGNTGLFDQLMALEWIKDNIEFFGGNPNNITLMGESAGATSISMLLLSPLSRNLFSQAIMQSGSATVPWGIMSKKENMLRGQRLAEAVGCPTDMSNPSVVIDCLRSKNASELVNSETSNGVTDFPFVPIIDGAFFDKLPIEYLRNGDFKKCNILMGSNTEEGYWFIMYFLPSLFRREENVLITRAEFERSVRALFPYFNELILQAIMYQYTDWIDPEDGAKNRNAIDKMIGDYHFTCNVNEFAEYYSKSGNNVYMYYFKHRSSGSKWPKWTGVLHADEISFLFGQPLNPKYTTFTEVEQDLSRQMMTYWGNFIKTGNPSEGDHRSFAKTKWPLYSPATKEYLILSGEESGLGRGPRLKECAFWKSFLPQLVKHSEYKPSQGPEVCPSSTGNNMDGLTSGAQCLTCALVPALLFACAARIGRFAL
ncbi:acetylcholinesterase [Hyalella azteca]|uniref:Carboxylic ester hydrolase n=1 Tax=Hyalella azteca TaxID=294128 RepID=A0A8B7PGN0_HYAAZ|nr:acetylcholinesterase [Hyalella azteca]